MYFRVALGQRALNVLPLGESWQLHVYSVFSEFEGRWERTCLRVLWPVYNSQFNCFAWGIQCICLNGKMPVALHLCTHSINGNFWNLCRCIQDLSYSLQGWGGEGGYWVFVPRDATKYFQNWIMNGYKFQTLRFLTVVYEAFIYFSCLSIHALIWRTVLNILLLHCDTTA
jgi:hypothetical protein